MAEWFHRPIKKAAYPIRKHDPAVRLRRRFHEIREDTIRLWVLNKKASGRESDHNSVLGA